MPAQQQKKIAAINDLTGYGRCALTVALPVISHLKLQCCPVPTSILSNHTGFSEYFFDDYTERLSSYINMWKKLDLSFDGIMSGFLGSAEQISMVMEFIHTFRTKDSLILIDPVMGDHGTISSVYTEEMCLQMRKLVAFADILTPNLTEACKLTDTPYHNSGWRFSQLLVLAEKLAKEGPDKIVITGIPRGSYIANFVYEKGKEPHLIETRRVFEERCGTGDLISAIIMADAVNGVDFAESVRRAAEFVRISMLETKKRHIAQKNGVCFEEVLDQLSYR